MILDFPLLAKGPLSEALLQKGINSYAQATSFVQALPYRRPSDKSRLLLLLEEHCGTCSSKHAFLKQLAIEQEQAAVQLIIGIYRMNVHNTPGIGKHLVENDLAYIPEAHCYLRYQSQRFDFTNPQSDISHLEAAILQETEILPYQIGSFKEALHKQYLKDWLQTQPILLTIDQIWNIRERCIASLSGTA